MERWPGAPVDEPHRVESTWAGQGSRAAARLASAHGLLVDNVIVEGLAELLPQLLAEHVDVKLSPAILLLAVHDACLQGSHLVGELARILMQVSWGTSYKRRRPMGTQGECDGTETWTWPRATRQRDNQRARWEWAVRNLWREGGK